MTGRGAAAAGLVAVTVVALLLLFRRTAASIVGIWESSADYNYGYFVVPATAYLIWDRRAALAGRVPRVEPRALIAVVLGGLLWLLGSVTGVQAVMHYALLGMILAAVTAILGTEIVRTIAFPLGFLFFAVPFGDILLPFLTESTVRLTLAACHLIGIPVARQLAFLKVPGGEFQIVTTCAGLRFLTASIALGYIYAALTYRGALRRTLFLCSAVAVALLANGLRVSTVVTVGYLTAMRSPLVNHHYTFGWIVFAVATYLLFWIGSRFRESPGPGPERAAAPAPGASPAFLRSGGIVAALALLLAVPWPAYAARLERQGAGAHSVALAIPEGVAGWAREPRGDWEIDPAVTGVDARASQFYGRGDQDVWLYVGFYAHPRHGAELVQAENTVVNVADPIWETRADSQRVASLPGAGTLPVREKRLSGPRTVRIWISYWVAGEWTNSLARAKLREAWCVLRGRRVPEAVVVVGTPELETPEATAGALAAFASQMLPSIEGSLAAAAGR